MKKYRKMEGVQRKIIYKTSSSPTDKHPTFPKNVKNKSDKHLDINQ